MNRWDPLQFVPARLGEEALRISGMRKGNTTPGTQVLMRELRPIGWTMGECHEAMGKLQELAEHLCRFGPLPRMNQAQWIKYRQGMAAIIFKSHGGTDPCPCLWCRIWRMWLEEWEEAHSDY